MEKVKIGIDLGGSHVAIGVVDDSGKIIEQFEKDFTTKEKENLIETAENYIVEIIEKLKIKYEFFKIGIGMAGSIQNGVILKSVNLGVKGYNLKEKLEKKINLNVTIRNDAKCAAIAEYKYGNNMKNYKNIIFLTLGTGIGGAFIHDGNLITGSMSDGYEFGHMLINPNGPICKCGKKGCFETYGGILAFKKKVIERLGLSYDISGPELRKKMSEKMDDILDIIEQYIFDLSIGISNLINIFEPDLIVIGGGFARYDYLLLDRLKSYLSSSNLLFNERSEVNIKTAEFGNDAGIIGASLL